MKYRGQPQSGSQAMTTASRNPWGQYFRARIDPDETATARRQLQWDSVTAASQAWATLTDQERRVWFGADLVNRTDSLGQDYMVEGQQLFVSVNVRRLLRSLTILNVPDPREATSLDSIGFVFSGASMLLSWSGVGSANTELWVQGSYPMSAGRSFCAQWKRFYEIGWLTSQPFDLAAGYSIDFGGAPASGKRVFLRAWAVAENCLDVSPKISVSAVAP